MLDQLGKYSILEEIGRGSMGMVYKAKDKNIGRITAIKTIKLPDTSADEQQELTVRFKQEAMAAGNLNHPNIVTIYEYDQVQDIAFIAMEFIEGIELKSYLDNNKIFTEQHILVIMKQLLAALQYSHQHGVIHRDIKPSNLMITDNELIKVMDFGIARLESSELTQVGTTIGTPSYMSPEQCTGKTVDARSDIFSAGVLLYQLLTNEKPFAGPSITSILHKITQISPPDPSQLNYSISKTFDSIVSRALAKRPVDRFQSAKEFSEALEKINDNSEYSINTTLPDAQIIISTESRAIKNGVNTNTAAKPLDNDVTIAVPLDNVDNYLNVSDETVVTPIAEEHVTDEDATIAVPLDNVDNYLNVSDETVVTPIAEEHVTDEDATIAVSIDQVDDYLVDNSMQDQTVVVPNGHKNTIQPSVTTQQKNKGSIFLTNKKLGLLKNTYVFAGLGILLVIGIIVVLQKAIFNEKPSQNNHAEFAEQTVTTSPAIQNESTTQQLPQLVSSDPVFEKEPSQIKVASTSELENKTSTIQTETSKQSIDPSVVETTAQKSKDPISSKPEKLYSFEIISNPPGAVIEHANMGIMNSITPMDVFLKQGLHQLYITKKDYQDLSVVIDLNEINGKKLEIDLIPK